MNTFCKATHLHGFYELSKSHSKAGKVIWFIAVAVALSVTTYLVIDAGKEFFSEPVRIVLKHADPEDVTYPPMKFCFSPWITWVNWSKVKKLGFTKHELLYAMSYLTDVSSAELFDVPKVENSFKNKLSSKNMTLKEFYLAIAKRRNVFYELSNRNYTIEFTAINKPDTRNIFHLMHTICYVFSEAEMKNLITEAKLYSQNNSMDSGYNIKIDIRSLAMYDYYEYLTKEEKLSNVEAYMEEIDWEYIGEGLYAPFLFYPDINVPSIVYLNHVYSALAIVMSLSIYSKKNSAISGRGCIEGQKSAAKNLTFLDYCFEKTRAQIFLENDVIESWIGYLNDVSPKKISFLDEKGNVLEHMTHVRHHKLESWSEDPEKIRNAHDKMIKLKAESLKSQKTGCEIMDITFELLDSSEYSGLFVPIIYPNTSQIVVREEEIVFTFSNFIANVGGVLGIWTGASIVTIIQIIHLLCGCARGKKRRSAHNHNE